MCSVARQDPQRARDNGHSSLLPHHPNRERIRHRRSATTAARRGPCWRHAAEPITIARLDPDWVRRAAAPDGPASLNGPPNRLESALADRYRLERELGTGGMAIVYLARDVRHDTKTKQALRKASERKPFAENARDAGAATRSRPQPAISAATRSTSRTS